MKRMLLFTYQFRATVKFFISPALKAPSFMSTPAIRVASSHAPHPPLEKLKFWVGSTLKNRPSLYLRDSPVSVHAASPYQPLKLSELRPLLRLIQLCVYSPPALNGPYTPFASRPSILMSSTFPKAPESIGKRFVICEVSCLNLTPLAGPNNWPLPLGLR